MSCEQFSQQSENEQEKNIMKRKKKRFSLSATFLIVN